MFVTFLAIIGALTCCVAAAWVIVQAIVHGDAAAECVRSHKRVRRERDALADRTEALEAELRELRESSPYRGRVLSERA